MRDNRTWTDEPPVRVPIVEGKIACPSCGIMVKLPKNKYATLVQCNSCRVAIDFKRTVAPRGPLTYTANAQGEDGKVTPE